MIVPRAGPPSFAGKQSFDIQRVDYEAPEASGRQGGVQAGFPIWMAVWTVATLGTVRSDALEVWIDQMRGQSRRFYGADVSRPFPKAHRGGFAGMQRPDLSPFDGSATTWSVEFTGQGDCLLSLEGLPFGLTLSNKDYIGFKWDDAEGEEGNHYRRALVRVVGGGAANGDGELTVTVEPTVPGVVPEDAVCHLDNPCCVMTLLSGQTKLGAIGRRLAIEGGTVAAVQDLRP